MMISKGLSIALFILAASCSRSFAYPVAEIKIDGVANDQTEIVKTLTGIFPGDEQDPAKAERAVDKIQDFFAAKGYPAVQVDFKTSGPATRAILNFHIELGTQLKILEVEVVSRSQILSENLKQKLLQAVDLKIGEAFDRDRIKDMQRSIESVLFSQNYIDSHVVELKTAEVDQGSKITFYLELGQKVILSVTNNHYYGRADLMGFIEDQRKLGLGRDYIEVLTNRLKSLYGDQGFLQAKINPYSFEPRAKEEKRLVFSIEEGPRSFIREIKFDGNESFSDANLKEFFFRSASDRINSKIYNGKMVDEAAHTMIDELKKRGYLSAKMIAVKTEENPDASVNIRLFISEGLQTKIQSIDFHGNHHFSSEKLDEFLGLHEGDALNLVQLEDGLDQVKKRYRNLGYLNFKINNELSRQVVTYSEKNQFAYISLDLEEGQIIRLGNYDIFGIENTHRIVVERELRIQINEPLGEARVLETEARLRRLGIFSQVNLEFKESADDPEHAKDMRISVQEAVPGNTSAGIGFRNDLGVRVFGELSYANLWGMNHTWALAVTANRRLDNFRFNEYTAQMSYTWPWALLGETTFRPTLSAEKRQYIEFDAETYAFAANFDRMLYRPLKISGGLTYTLEHVKQFNSLIADQNQQIQIGSITPTLRVDLRDNPLVPRKGFFGLFSYEYANPFLGSQHEPVPVNYGRFQMRTDYYLDFIPHVVWFSSIRGGWLKNFADPYGDDGQIDPRVTVPLIKQFALGGINSIRGFVEQELNVQASDDQKRVQGYSTYVNYRTQMDYFPSANLSFGPFLDAGNLQVDAFSLGNLRYGTGLGMRYLTPVGPVNFDWGFKLFPRPGEQSNVFYFSLGVI